MRPAKGAPDRTSTRWEPTEDETGDIGSNGCRPLNEGNEVENNLEHPLLLITSTLPPAITTKMIKKFQLCSSTSKMAKSNRSYPELKI